MKRPSIFPSAPDAQLTLAQANCWWSYRPPLQRAAQFPRATFSHLPWGALSPEQQEEIRAGLSAGFSG